MEMIEALFRRAIATGDVKIKLEVEGADIASLMERESIVLLSRIREILRDDSLDDEGCFWKIEALVSLYEENGLFCGGRHDF